MLAVPPISYQHTLNVFNFATASRRRLGRVVVQDRGHSLGSGIALESANAAEHLVENSPEAENVSAAVYGSTTHLLGRHVSRSANDGTDASKRHLRSEERRV